MPETTERDARLVLAVLSEPGDRITGTLLGALGAEETLRLVTADTALRPVLIPSRGPYGVDDLPPASPRAGSSRPGSRATVSDCASSPQAHPAGRKACQTLVFSRRSPCGSKVMPGC
ncbi:hypothetical protein [Microbacterium schleiferi]|uniref:hypothetical protein n=1 Tax=Microbacterium schleiferi TaxID=69362 RepID=UPI001E39109E|nr:hypothetical protein [Microbacterium schleiferi]